MSAAHEMTIGSITFSPDLAGTIIDNMSQSIATLLIRCAELEQERDFYKAAATKLSKPAKRRRKQ